VLVQQYGADILRLWVAQSDYTADQRIGPEILKGAADSYRRLRNTFRYMLGALGEAEHPAVTPGDCPELERWVLHRLAELDAQVRDGYRRHDFQEVYQRLFQFCTTDLSAHWFDIRKDALYCDGPDSPRRRACLHVMAQVFARLTTWLAPLLPFTMEEVWLHRHPGEEGSVHLEDFPPTPGAWRDDALAAKWAAIWRIRRVVTGALEVERREKRIGASLEAAPVVQVEDHDARTALASVDLADLCITSAIVVTGEPAPDGAFRLPEVPGVAVVPAGAPGEKCQRCWRILPEVGDGPDPNLCGRCERVVRG
jgi:isoleucyl-tRNA synthetase